MEDEIKIDVYEDWINLEMAFVRALNNFDNVIDQCPMIMETRPTDNILCLNISLIFKDCITNMKSEASLTFTISENLVDHGQVERLENLFFEHISKHLRWRDMTIPRKSKSR